MAQSTVISGIEPFIHHILDVFSDGIYISDHTGKTLKVNKMYEKLTGLKSEELTGRLVTDLKQEGKYDVVLNPDIVRTGKPKTLVQQTKKGRNVLLNGFPVFDQQGNVAIVVTFVRDVTLLSQMKDQIASQQQLIDKYHREVEYLCKKKHSSKPLVYESNEMQRVLDLIIKVADTDATTLFLGETGVGKDVLARQIHEHSLRSKELFFKVDCTSIPENLIESELFGYEAGAFSGAKTKGKPGFFELANNGTLFLDEIGELPLAMQGKLLRVLQDQEILPVGGTKVKKIDVRIVAATNRNLEEAVTMGEFRSDLYYRLRVAVINIPSLRQRQDDILPLATHFLNVYNGRYKKDVGLSSEVEDLFLRYKWPGNVRELENMVQSLVVISSKATIDINDLPNSMLANQISKDTKYLPESIELTDKSLTDIMGEIEKKLLQDSLEQHGSLALVAKQLKVDRTTVFRKLKKYGII